MKQASLLILGGTLLSGACATASAQSDVTIYGIVDVAMIHLTHHVGSSDTYMRSGPKDGSRLGFKGTEDLGNGTKALFVLEAGYNVDDGTAGQTNSLFNRAAYVGLSNKSLGTVTVGRQYAPYFEYLSPLGPVPPVTGSAGDHPGDIDGMDITIRNNNSVKYTSPTWHGFTLGVMGATGEQARDSAGPSGDAYSAAIKFESGAWRSALAYQVLKNGPKQASWDTTTASSFSKSQLNAGYLSANDVQYVAAGTHWQQGALGLGGSVSNVQYRPNEGSLFHSTAIFNTGALVGTWQTATPWLLGAGLTYTRATSANGITDAASYRQLSLQQAYWFSKRTSVYVLEALQVAHGQTLAANGVGTVDAGAIIGTSQSGLLADGRRQTMLGLGLRHAF
jgi:predicted porin